MIIKSKVLILFIILFKYSRRIIIVIFNIIVLLSEIVILSTIFYYDLKKSIPIYRGAQSHFLNVLYILSILAFILYGIGLYRKWRNMPLRKTYYGHQKMKLTLLLTITVLISFCIRIIVNGLWPHVIVKWKYRYPFEACYYFFIEVIPIAMLLYFNIKNGLKYERILTIDYTLLEDNVS